MSSEQMVASIDFEEWLKLQTEHRLMFEALERLEKGWDNLSADVIARQTLAMVERPKDE